MKFHLRNFLFLSLLVGGLCSCVFMKKSQSPDAKNSSASTLARNPSSYIPAFSPGVHKEGQGFRFTLQSLHAEKVQLLLFGKAMGEAARIELFLERVNPSTWTLLVTNEDLQKNELSEPILYGYRLWGPNWTPGSQEGFISHVDKEGNRFNPNKLLFDPYALELSHDPRNKSHPSGIEYASGEKYFLKDNALVAPKGIYIESLRKLPGQMPRISRKLKDEIIYETHIKGLTKNNLDVPEDFRGTYKGAAYMVPYLKKLGITAIQFLPVQETQNDHNDLEPNSAKDDQYWGYMTLNYFAPDRRFSFDQSPGGPTKEFRDMVRVFHAQGIKVYLDVVYNHTGEGGLWDATGNTADLFSYRGIDNQSYYLLAEDRRFYYDNTGTGHNINSSNPLVGNLVIDSLKHWQTLGVDGFRFDLAAVLGNECDRNCARFNKMKPENILNRAAQELPGRDINPNTGIDLIAEPWAIGMYALGDFPRGWAEWNGKYRDTLRKKMNKLGYENVTPAELVRILGGALVIFTKPMVASLIIP